jgi:hypothetical protein
MFHGEALHSAVVKGTTNFPKAVALGGTWDPALLERADDNCHSKCSRA